MKANCVFGKDSDHNKLVTKHAYFNVTFVYYRQVFVKNLQNVCLVWCAIDCTYCIGLVFGNNNSKNVFYVFREI